MKQNLNPVVHFEMPFENRDRMAEFYTQAFGWNMQKLGAEMGNYVTAQTAPTDEHNMVKTPGTINGGFYQKDPNAPYPSVVIAVENIQNAMQNITKAGGKILGEPMNIPGIGTYVSFTDTEGNRVSILEPQNR